LNEAGTLAELVSFVAKYDRGSIASVPSTSLDVSSRIFGISSGVVRTATRDIYVPVVATVD
jgi:hypothetical protein